MKTTSVAPLLLAITLIGCSKAPTPVGKWTGTMQGQTVAIEYKDDKTMTAIPQNAPAGMTMTLSGTWSQEGEKLTQTLTKFDAPGLPPQAKSMVEGAMKGVLNKPQTGTVKFEGETMTVTDDKGQATTLTRATEKK